MKRKKANSLENITCTELGKQNLQTKKVYMMWFNFILGLNFIFLCLKVVIIYYHTPKQRKIKI